MDAVGRFQPRPFLLLRQFSEDFQELSWGMHQMPTPRQMGVPRNGLQVWTELYFGGMKHFVLIFKAFQGHQAEVLN